MKIRLHQYLSKSGLFLSKKLLLDAIYQGKVKVQGRVVKQPHFQFSMEKEVAYNDQKISMVQSHHYLVLNKPLGYVCSKHIPEGKKSVFSLINEPLEMMNRLSSVGRLDEDTTGLLVLTTDGSFVHRLMHPTMHLQKTYEVTLARELSELDAKRLCEGVMIPMEENGMKRVYHTKPAKVEMASSHVLLLTLHEGKKRQVKKMAEAVGNAVVALKRVAIGGLILTDLGINEGQYKSYTKEQLEQLIFAKSTLK